MTVEREYNTETYDELEIKPLGIMLALILLAMAWAVIKAKENWLVIAGIAVWAGIYMAIYRSIGRWLK